MPADLACQSCPNHHFDIANRSLSLLILLLLTVSVSTHTMFAEPEIHEHLLGPQDEFLVMATDGLWDVMSSKAAIDLVRLQLRIHNNPTRAAEKLVEMAQGWHTKDNVTVLIVQLCASLPAIELNPSRPGSCAGNRLRSGV